MNVQDETIRAYCKQLSLLTLAEDYSFLAQSAAEKEMSYTDFLEKVLNQEIKGRQERHREMLLKMVGFPVIKTLEEFDFNFNRAISKAKLMELASLTFLAKKENLVFLGPSRVGKSHLSIALGYLSVNQRLKTKFMSAADLLLQLETAIRQERYTQYMKHQIRAPALLIIDEIGYLPMNKQQANLFFQVIATRYEKGSMILSSNHSFGTWPEVFANDSALTAALLDRLLHHAHVLSFAGSRSYRLKDKVKAGVMVERAEPQKVLEPAQVAK